MLFMRSDVGDPARGIVICFVMLRITRNGITIKMSNGHGDTSASLENVDSAFVKGSVSFSYVSAYQMRN